MGKRHRRPRAAAEVVEYADADGNVLGLRASISALSARKLSGRARGAASLEDDWQRRMEILFERFAVSWTITGLPLNGQAELLGRYRLADSDTQRWVHKTLTDHVATHQPEIDAR